MHLREAKAMKLYRTVPVLAALAASGLLLSACAADADPGSATTSDSIVVYSNSVSDGRGEYLVEQASAAGFDVEYVDLGGGEVTDRIIAEKNNPVADVAFGPNDVSFEHMKTAGALEAYTPAWAGKVEAKDPDGMYFSVVQEPIMLVYRSQATSKMPQDWTDLFTDEAYKGRYETKASLGGATTQMVVSSLLARYRDDSGELGVSDEGWAAIEKFFANGSPEVEGTDLFARLKSGEVDAGQMCWLER